MNDGQPADAPPSGAEQESQSGVEAEEKKDEREDAGERDKAASRKATEASRGKRRRGGGLGSRGSP